MSFQTTASPQPISHTRLIQKIAATVFCFATAWLCDHAARADVVTFDATSFLNGTRPGYYRESFSGLSQSNYTEPLAFTDGNSGGYSYNVTTDSGGGIYVAPPSSSNTALLAISPATGSDLIFTFLGLPVTSFGGNFFPADTAGSAQPGSIMLLLSDGTTQLVSATAANLQPFLGIQSQTPLSSVTIRYTGSDSYFPSVTNLIVGRASITIPEAGTIPLVSAAIIFLPILAASLRQRRVRRLFGDALAAR